MEKRTLAAIGLSVLVLLGFKFIQDERARQLARTRPPVQREAVLPTPAPPPTPATTAQLPPEEPRQSSTPQPSDTHAGEQAVVLEGAL